MALWDSGSRSRSSCVSSGSDSSIRRGIVCYFLLNSGRQTCSALKVVEAGVPVVVSGGCDSSDKSGAERG